MNFSSSRTASSSSTMSILLGMGDKVSTSPAGLPIPSRRGCGGSSERDWTSGVPPRSESEETKVNSLGEGKESAEMKLDRLAEKIRAGAYSVPAEKVAEAI